MNAAAHFPEYADAADRARNVPAPKIGHYLASGQRIDTGTATTRSGDEVSWSVRHIVTTSADPAQPAGPTEIVIWDVLGEWLRAFPLQDGETWVWAATGDAAPAMGTVRAPFGLIRATVAALIESL